MLAETSSSYIAWMRVARAEHKGWGWQQPVVSVCVLYCSHTEMHVNKQLLSLIAVNFVFAEHSKGEPGSSIQRGGGLW